MIDENIISGIVINGKTKNTDERTHEAKPCK